MSTIKLILPFQKIHHFMAKKCFLYHKKSNIFLKLLKRSARFFKLSKIASSSFHKILLQGKQVIPQNKTSLFQKTNHLQGSIGQIKNLVSLIVFLAFFLFLLVVPSASIPQEFGFVMAMAGTASTVQHFDSNSPKRNAIGSASSGHSFALQNPQHV